MMPDRRRHTRILTLKNFRRLALVFAILIVVLIVQADLRHSVSGEYGRLFAKQIPRQNVVNKVDVVREAPAIADETSADPLLLAPAAREQYLGVTTTALTPPVVTTTTQTDGNVAVVSGPNGVTIVRGDVARQPVLSGGIFRQ